MLVVHLLFDAIVFMVLVHAHSPHLFDVFVTAPADPLHHPRGPA